MLAAPRHENNPRPPRSTDSSGEIAPLRQTPVRSATRTAKQRQRPLRRRETRIRVEALARASTRWAKVVRGSDPPARNARANPLREDEVPGRAPTQPTAWTAIDLVSSRRRGPTRRTYNVSTASHTSATLTPSASAESSQPVTGSSSAWPEHERLTPWSERLIMRGVGGTPLCTAVSA